MIRVDLNCDLGESTDASGEAREHSILSHVTSVNIACGVHAGDADVMRRTVAAALMHGAAIGAHPGLADRDGFGRRDMPVSAEETYHLVLDQIASLATVTAAAGTALRHVKPHGALYNMAARRPELADAIARAIRDADSGLALYGLAGSHLLSAAEAAGLRPVSEVFADRNYAADGALVPRDRPNAFVHDVEEAVKRAVRMVRHGAVRTVDGAEIRLQADTVCIHGDGSHALELARALRNALDAEGIVVRPPGGSR